jgi:hypothetical protein
MTGDKIERLRCLRSLADREHPKNGANSDEMT